MVKVEDLNEMRHTEFVETLKDIFEHSPWVPERAWASRPFASVDVLHKEMIKVVEGASVDEQLTLIKSHPDLGARVEMSATSVKEQKGVGLNQLSEEEYHNFLKLNKEYMETFGFPFIIAVRGKSKEDIYLAMEERVNSAKEDEFNKALMEIYKIASFRLKDLIITEKATK